jgi:hypothetical protein
MGDVGGNPEGVINGVVPPTEVGRDDRTHEVFHLLEATESAIRALEARFGTMDARPFRESQP